MPCPPCPRCSLPACSQSVLFANPPIRPAFVVAASRLFGLVYQQSYIDTPSPTPLRFLFAPAQAATPSLYLPTRPSLSTTHRSSRLVCLPFSIRILHLQRPPRSFLGTPQPVVPPGSSPGIDASHHLSTHPVHLRSPAPCTGPSAPVVDSHCRIAPSPHRARTRPIVACALAIGTVNIQLQPAFRPISTTCSARLPVRHLPRASLSLSSPSIARPPRTSHPSPPSLTLLLPSAITVAVVTSLRRRH